MSSVFRIRLAIASAAAICTAVAIVPADATPIAPGGSVAAALVPNPSGTILADTGLISFSYGSPLSTGTIRQIVIADAGNPFGAGDLSFVYQVSVATGDVGRVTGSSFAQFLTDVGINTPVAPFITTGTAMPSVITRSPGAGDVIGFDFTPSIVPDGGSSDTSVALIIRTDATAFQPGSIGVIDGGGQTLSGFAPIPEPASVALLSLGTAGIFAHGRKRNGSA
jgi:hypothetical protein